MKRILMAAAAILAATHAWAVDLPIAYKERSTSDADIRKMWGDLLPLANPLGQYAPWVMLGTLSIGEGRTLVISQLWAGGLCSSGGCPIRVYEGDEMILDDMACSDEDNHLISDDGRTLYACDNALRINRR